MTDETNAIIANQQTPREKFEQERLSRRAALRKIGMTSGMAFFGLFAVDDLARLAIKQMEQHKETRQVAETVAKEFKNSGVAFAADAGASSNNCPPLFCDCQATCNGVDGRTFDQCMQNCVNQNNPPPVCVCP